MNEPEYLGDGVYVRKNLTENETVVIYTSAGGSPTNIIYFEPQVLRALKEWLAGNKL